MGALTYLKQGPGATSLHLQCRRQVAGAAAYLHFPLICNSDTNHSSCQFFGGSLPYLLFRKNISNLILVGKDMKDYEELVKTGDM